MTRVIALLSVLSIFVLIGGCSHEPVSSAGGDAPDPLASSDEAGGGTVAEPMSDPTIDPLVDPALDPQLQDFIQRSGIFARLFIQRSPDPEQLEAVLQQGDTDAFARLLGLDGRRVEEIMSDLRRRSEALLSTHPELAEEVDELDRMGSPPCDSWELVEVARRLRDRTAAGLELSWKEERMVCQWVPYVASLIACALSGNPLLYVACSTVAMCTWCEGGMVSSVCNAGT